MNYRLKTIMYLTIPPILWAGNSVVGKYASAFIGPFSLSFYRWLIASGLLLLIAAKPLYVHRRVLLYNWKPLAILGILGTGIFNTLLYLGLNTTSASNAGILLSSLPVIIIVLNYFMRLERASPHQIIGVIISITGVLWVVTRGTLTNLLQFELNPGDVFILVAIFSWGLYSVLLKRLRPAQLPALPFLAIQFLIGLAFIFPFYLYELSQGSTMRWDIQTGLVLTYVAIFPSLIAFFFWQQGVAMGGANIAGFISPLNIVFTTVFAYIFLGESLSGAQITGATLVLGGVILALSNSFRSRPASGPAGPH